MQKDYLIWGLLILLIGLLIFNFAISSINWSINKPAIKQKQAVIEKNTGFRSISTGSTDSGDVEIELTPKEVKNGKFEITLAVNTHSVDLSQFDLEKITSLEFEGKTLNPVSASKLSGHHSSGKLIFEINEELTDFKIKIKGIPKVEERLFEWR
ncbi:hypothetical protein COV11_04450 [Candidatus Woesearchaeota archaeon CG10_big_fil_rev_8_21_14_0_10_30_7]|nr:MAG: hypothetical protein COV11_04450 [Candidatus Woesearchaeota archaeon CG10_big_fil_rev_8_21_14_0_10_30_7]